MCGITGIFAYHQDAPPVDSEELLRIRDAMANRGPDGSGIWLSEGRRVGLAHRRLAILDLSEAGAQPMASAHGRYQIVFNGEIYNYRQLRDDLGSKGYAFRSTSDTEVLLALYEEYGEDMVHRLRGMFAFAIWDSRERTLFLARDPFGIKPLYFADDGKTLRFASQVKALLAGGGVSESLDFAGVASFYTLGFVAEPFTLRRAISVLPAGHCLLVSLEGLGRSESYFDLTEELALAEQAVLDQPGLPNYLRENLPEYLLDSVRGHLVSDVPVGIFLSSGMDSSSLVSLARQSGANDLRTVTLGFREYQGRMSDETVIAESSAAHFGTSHKTHWIGRSDFAEHLDHALAAMDQPSVDGLNTYFVAKAAADSGLKVAMSGLGGDEFFGGYPSFRQVPLLPRLLRGFRSTPQANVLFRNLTRPLTGKHISPKWASLLEHGSNWPGAYFLRRALFLPWEFKELSDPESLEEGWKKLDLLARLQGTIRGLRSSRACLVALEVSWYMRNQLLRDSDWASMAHSLELRVPLVDRDFFRRLAPLIVSNPPLRKREVFKRLPLSLPQAVLDRPKTGFNMPFRQWSEDISGKRGTERGVRGWARQLMSHFPEPLTLAQLQGEPGSPRRVLIFRIGSLGDTVVALPSFHLIAKAFPTADLKVLTNFPEHRKAPPLSAILGTSGLAHGYLEYPPKGSFLQKVLYARRQIRRFSPDLVIYLMPTRTPKQLRRDQLFFRLCGIKRMLGVPESESQRQGEFDEKTGLWTHESRRLLSTLARLGNMDLKDSKSWDFHFSAQEESRAQQAIQILPPGPPILALSMGTKNSVNEWGLENWRTLLASLPELLAGWSLMLMGAPEDHAPSASLAEKWPGTVVNLCGELTPRESAAALRKASLFLGQDSGPMHLAAAVGVPCVAVFSARNRPGEWFPFGADHRVVRRDVACAGCRLTHCITEKKRCILGITVEEVLQALHSVVFPDTTTPGARI